MFSRCISRCLFDSKTSFTCLSKTGFKLNNTSCMKSACHRDINTYKSNLKRSLIPFSSQVVRHFSAVSRKAPQTWLTQRLVTSLKTFRQSTTQAVPSGTSEHAQKMVGRWLLLCSGMTFGAVVLGGITRLTESGLSMVSWHLIKDMKPPTSQAQWQAEFERYQSFPEWQYLNKGRGMTLTQFKQIFYMEWLHRMWGRAIGLVFALPAAYFWHKGWFNKGMKPRVIVFGGLILFQGLLGWYMVKSGLEEKTGPSDVPRVSQYRLASHLGSAVILYSLLFWSTLNHLVKDQKVTQKVTNLRTLKILGHSSKAMIFVTTIAGAFVAGLDAGLVYNSWPKMGDRWIPQDIATFEPKWKNITENPTTVQFNHRHLGEITLLTIAALWVVSRKVNLPSRARLAVNCMLGMSLIQGALGVTTLLTYVPVSVAASHQAGSLILMSYALWFTNELKRIPK